MIQEQEQETPEQRRAAIRAAWRREALRAVPDPFPALAEAVIRCTEQDMRAAERALERLDRVQASFQRALQRLHCEARKAHHACRLAAEGLWWFDETRRPTEQDAVLLRDVSRIAQCEPEEVSRAVLHRSQLSTARFLRGDGPCPLCNRAWKEEDEPDATASDAEP